MLKISRRYQGIMEKWTNKLMGNTWCKKISRYSGIQKTEATGNYAFPGLKIGTQGARTDYLATSSALHTLASECTFSILFSIHFLKCWQGEFV